VYSKYYAWPWGIDNDQEGMLGVGKIAESIDIKYILIKYNNLIEINKG
jgi:hypothetical protein